MMKVIDDNLLNELLTKAAESPRRRTNYNLHETTDDAINRLVIAAMPDTVVHPHRHMTKWELFTSLCGELICYTYDDAGNVLESCRLGGDVRSIEIPAGVWHNFVAVTPGAALEVKAGPYAPLLPEETALFDGILPKK